MEKAYSIVMFIFSGALFVYAGLIAMGNPQLIRRLYAAKVNDKKAYCRQFAKIMALAAVAPALSGLVGLFTDVAETPMPAVMTLIGGIVGSVIWGTYIMKDQ